ncbi:MAG: phasin family protein [Myxococcaceae bacterium]|nr:phasin family protein [Myxococcaceae bacterium]
MAEGKRALTDLVEKTWGQLEKSVEDAVQRSLSKVKFPRREQLQEFSERLDRVERRLSELEGKR